MKDKKRMKNVRFEYIAALKLAVPVKDHYFSIRCVPQSTAGQRIERLNVTLFPETKTWRNTDSFGNAVISGSYSFPHLNFVFAVSGTAAVDSMAHDTSGYMDCYRFPSKLTVPGKGILDFYNRIRPDAGISPYERAMEMTNRLFEVFRYEKRITDVKTTAEQAFELKRGVCQDYAHILLCLLRLDRIPCRYAAGLLAGEGETHGWAEIYDGGWIGIDPTHNRRVNDRYLRITQGRDFSDCAIDRGIIFGSCGEQNQTVSAYLSEDA